MKLIEADYSWEVNPELSEYSILYTSLRAAKSEALRLIKEQMKETKQNQEKYGTQDVPIAPLKVTISAVQVTRLSPTAVAQIINGQGRYWREGVERKLIEITFGPDDKKPVVKTFAEGKRG